jgi:hypothetical protein
MENVIKQKEFYKIVEQTSHVKVFDWDSIKRKVDEYLTKNEIGGDKYKCTGVGTNLDYVEVKLSRIDSREIDEDFIEDEGWESFCEEMAEKLEVRLFTQPYWYSPK